MGLRDFTLFDAIERNARLDPDGTAFIFEGLRVTHAEHRTRVERLAAGFAEAGVAVGDRIAILSHNNLEFVDLYGAAARLGAILVPINWRLSTDEIAHVVTDAGPKVVVADVAHQQTLAAKQQEFASIRHWYGIGGQVRPFAPFDKLLSTGGNAQLPDVPADAPYVMFYTAAVTGRPRGALLTQAGMMASNVQLLYYWSLTRQDVNLGILPLFHLAGLNMLLAAQHAGGATIVLPRFDADAVVQCIRDRNVTLFAEFPPILSTVLDKAAADSNLSSLRVVTGLDTPEMISRFERQCPDASFWVAFGQSETSGFVTMAPFRDKPGSAGRPTFLNTVEIVDDLDRPLPIGQIGEIVVRGPSVFKGYWNYREDTAFTFRNGWHHTGDNGAFDADGYLWYKGRSPTKELIKPGGENVYPAEVEGAIAAHPAIAEVVVFGVSDAEWGEAVKAICVCKPGWSVTAEEIIDFVAGRIARFKRPKLVIFVDRLPKSASGTIDRNQIKATYGHA